MTEIWLTERNEELAGLLNTRSLWENLCRGNVGDEALEVLMGWESYLARCHRWGTDASLKAEAQHAAGTQRTTVIFGEIPSSTLGCFSLYHPVFHSMWFLEGQSPFQWYLMDSRITDCWRLGSKGEGIGNVCSLKIRSHTIKHVTVREDGK